jgi:hypothetical protein
MSGPQNPRWTRIVQVMTPGPGGKPAGAVAPSD